MLLSSDEEVVPLKICTGSKAAGGKVTCMNLTEVEVHSPEEVISIIQTAQEKRRVGETKMNKQSSRELVRVIFSALSSVAAWCFRFTLHVHIESGVEGKAPRRRD